MVKVRLKSETIEKTLARNNLSQNGLAIKLGVSSGYMSQLLKGQRLPSPKLRERFLAYYNQLSFDDLFEILK